MKTKITLGAAIAIIGAGAWWAATMTTDMRHIKTTIEPIPQMQQDIAMI